MHTMTLDVLAYQHSSPSGQNYPTLRELFQENKYDTATSVIELVAEKLQGNNRNTVLSTLCILITNMDNNDPSLASPILREIALIGSNFYSGKALEAVMEDFQEQSFDNPKSWEEIKDHSVFHYDYHKNINSAFEATQTNDERKTIIQGIRNATFHLTRPSQNIQRQLAYENLFRKYTGKELLKKLIELEKTH